MVEIQSLISGAGAYGSRHAVLQNRTEYDRFCNLIAGGKMAFYTAVNCMDGRVQLPVILYLRERFGTDYIDMITEPGPVAILSENPGLDAAKSIFNRIDISIEKHRSAGIAVVGHCDCAGNPVPEEVQREQLRKSVQAVGEVYPDVKVIGLWVDETWSVMEIEAE
jgi:carbonic anhydrase